MVGEQWVEDKSDYVNRESRTLLDIYNLKDSSQATGKNSECLHWP